MPIKTSLKILTTVGIHGKIDKHQPSLKDILDIIPDTTKNAEEKYALLRYKETDKYFSFFDSKVQSTVCCCICRAHICIYFHNAIGFPGGPSRDQINELNRWVEGGYVCGNKVRDAPFYARRKLICGDYIEPQYYNPNAGKRGGRIVTVYMCDICFEDDDIVSRDDIKNNKCFGGKRPLSICSYCFNSNIKVSVTNGMCNLKEKKQQNKGVWKTQLGHRVASG